MYTNTQWGILSLLTNEVMSSLLWGIPGMSRTIHVDCRMQGMHSLHLQTHSVSCQCVDVKTMAYWAAVCVFNVAGCEKKSWLHCCQTNHSTHVHRCTVVNRIQTMPQIRNSDFIPKKWDDPKAESPDFLLFSFYIESFSSFGGSLGCSPWSRLESFVKY